MSLKTIKIGIADDHNLFRKGIIAVLSSYPDLEIVCEAENGQALLEQMPVYKPEIVILDLMMPLMDGTQTALVLKQQYPDVKIIILSMVQDEAHIVKLFGIGAKAFLLKNIEPHELAFAIREVQSMGRYFSDIVSGALANEIAVRVEQIGNSPEKALSDREIEVVKLMVAELTNQEIGDKLHLSARTVEGHRKRIQNKIGARNMAGIIVYAAKKGWLN